ncbi:ABC transporter substrate-binding protein [Parvibium lacunae]|uniref:ABC transporter substrate-binding protein n=1 Tax=Parvibium lacunae TaxID=1888893 RepID=A0A368L1A0_9BURK|nr:ABC transporter substrate-binding protein [Parvibium lacunae]RCS57336.1 ABC transporter substrate-binding protein [Parvibium lacunae]
MSSFLRLLFLPLYVLFTLVPTVAYAQEILIGQVAPYTGNLAPTGNDYRRGIEIWFEHLNARGGIKGRKLKLVGLDDGYKTEDTVKQTKQILTNNDIVALAGFVGTGNVEAVLKSGLLEEHRIPLIGVRTGGILTHYPYLFHLRANYRDEVQKMLQHASTIGLKNIGVFYQDDSFGKVGLQAAEEFAKEYGLNILAKGAYEKNTTKVENAVETMLKAEPQAIIMISNTAASAAFIKQLRERNNSAYLFIQSVTDGEQLAQRISDNLARGVVIAQVMPNPYKRSLPLSRDFHLDVAKSRVEGAKVNYTTLEGYVTGKVITAALERAPKITRQELTRSLERLRRLDLGGFIIDFDEKNHRGSPYVELSVISAGGKVIQ